MLTSPRLDILVVSPHLDDAFFSLGGLLERSRSRRVMVVDVFTTSAFAPRLKRFVTEKRVISAVRRREEWRNLRAVRAESTFLGFPEAPLRGYATSFDPPKWSLEGKCMASIWLQLTEMVSSARVTFFPLGIGGNLDHLMIARLGVESLLRGRGRVMFYEDLPYASNLPRLWGMTNPSRILGMEPMWIPIDAISKLKLCLSYKSQCLPQVPLKIVVYSKLTKAFGGMYERVWRVNCLENFRRSRFAQGMTSAVSVQA